MAQQEAVHAGGEQLPDLPGVELNDLGTPAFERQLYEHRNGRRAHGRHALHELAQARKIERTVFHPDVDVVRPGIGHLHARLEVEGHAGVPAGVEHRFVGGELGDRAVDAGHQTSAWYTSVFNSRRMG